jgi:serine/threonine protein kinase
LGLIVYELAAGIFPYSFSNVLIENVQNIIEGPEISLPNNGTFSIELQDFLSKCLKKNYKQRSTVKDLYVFYS